MSELTDLANASGNAPGKPFKVPKAIVTSGHLRAALRERFSESHAVLFEVGNSTGHGTSRHIDAIAMGLWPSRGMEVEGVEIKVSRGDWKRELADHAKADAIQRYCDRWWIAAPAGLIPPAELPASWGLLELGDTLRVKVQAPKLEPLPLSRTFVAAMLRRAGKVDKEELELAVQAATIKINADAKRHAEHNATRMRDDAQKILDNAAAIKAATGIDLKGWAPSADVIAAIRFATSTGLASSYGLMHQAKRHAEGLADALAQFHAILSPTKEDPCESPPRP